MITFLRGVLRSNFSSRITIDVNGMGYEVIVPISSSDAFGHPGDTVTVLTYLYVREQELTLFGFSSNEEREVFRLLLDRVSGVGPKVAMAVLGGMPVAEFKAAVVSSDITAISKIRGVGKKTAERMVLELKDKVGVAAAWEAASAQQAPSPEQTVQNDAVLALISLGYKQAEAAKAVMATAREKGTEPGDVETLVRAALRQLQ